ncbi:MAG: hypothetical protein RQM92_16300 [Candidatus Syntrophopropionicum ammoniitolerans]
MNKISRVGRVYSLILLLSIVSVSFLYGCGGKVQPQKKLINNRNQGVKIAVSFADMERDGNMVIKNTMTARQKGSQGQQKEQQGQQQEGPRNNNKTNNKTKSKMSNRINRVNNKMNNKMNSRKDNRVAPGRAGKGQYYLAGCQK